MSNEKDSLELANEFEALGGFDSLRIKIDSTFIMVDDLWICSK